MKETKSGETSGATANQGANSGYGSSSSNANTSNVGSSSGYDTGTGAAAGAGIAGAGIAGHHASKSGDATATSGSSSHPNSSGNTTGYNDPSTTSSRQPQVSAGSSSGYKDQTSSRGATQPDYETSSSSAAPVSRETQPSSSSSHGYGKEATGAAAGLGAGGVAGGGVASNSSGSTEQSGTSENRKSGLFSRFSKKDASSVAKGAKEDASKFSGQAQGIASDVKKGDYSSAKKFAADAKENPDKYVGNTRSAFNESKSGSSAAGTKDTTNAASQVPSDSGHTSGHGVGKGAAVGAGAAGAGAYAASNSHSGSTQQHQSSGKSTGASGSGSSSTGAAGATLPPQLASDGSNGYQSKSTSGAHTSSGHESSTGYTGSKHDVFGNQPPQALKNSDAKGYTSAQQAEQEPSSGGQSTGGQSTSGHAGTGAAAGAAIGGAGVAAHSQGKSNEAPSSTKNEQGIPQNLSNPFTDGSAPQQQPNNPNADDVSGGEQKTLDPKSADQVKTSSGPDHQAPKSSTSKPSKVAATEDSHPTSLGVDNQDKSSGSGYGFGGIAAGLAGAAGATGLASKIGGGGSNQETKEGSIPSGGQKVSSNLSKDAAGEGYLETAKGYAENAGSTFNDYVQVAADKADEYAKGSDNKYIGQGNEYVQQLAEKSDEYAKQHGESSKNKSVSDSKSSAGAAATKPSSGGKQSGQELSNKSSKVGGAGASSGAAGATGATGAATSGSTSGAAGSTSGTSASGSSAAAQFANKKSGQDEQEQSESLPKHFQHENKNPFSGKTGPVPGTEDQVIPHTQTSDIPKAEQGYGATHAAHGHTASAQPTKASDSLQPPRANAGYDTDSNSSTSSPKKRGLLSKIKQKVKGESSAPSSTQGTPKKTST
ncbi:hypothetical protein WICANDRAFT_84230 [Wickerhamomyces anomalus NRRL Y-366-8]|uniref:Uncharacterized protein n=1 Tax=Wickerhamomyces anomalus (strain ATCC 58044 / CBS 1984 / NCYC 433 / NRRL Y-366-8) TaxID=683960 RepID=A0A1E3P531_WICAA|nr:uncharacterized protein WICANDRAFT_84230 [Wickerhamomyces anomalus NRRL Y-366-8]ODQ60354.1 hypothetical protein WICANDRAFT_84230 [Wickerhamomyces anomalus NRRL Y-366-8]